MKKIEKIEDTDWIELSLLRNRLNKVISAVNELMVPNPDLFWDVSLKQQRTTGCEGSIGNDPPHVQPNISRAVDPKCTIFDGGKAPRFEDCTIEDLAFNHQNGCVADKIPTKQQRMEQLDRVLRSQWDYGKESSFGEALHPEERWAVHAAYKKELAKLKEMM